MTINVLCRIKEIGFAFSYVGFGETNCPAHLAFRQLVPLSIDQIES